MSNALTDSDSDTHAKCIWKDDFKPVVGHNFNFELSQMNGGMGL